MKPEKIAQIINDDNFYKPHIIDNALFMNHVNNAEFLDCVYVGGVEFVKSKRKKPPLGVKPRKLFIEERLNNLSEAISKYLKEYRDCPQNWIDEYNDLVKEYNAIK